jgi:hypothetical protein
MVGLARVSGALWFIVAGVIAETLVRTRHRYFLALLVLMVGAPGLIAALSARTRD